MKSLDLNPLRKAILSGLNYDYNDYNDLNDFQELIFFNGLVLLFKIILK